MGFEIRRNTSSVVKGAVDKFSDLSNIQNPQVNDYYLVRTSTGIPFINRKSSGLYYWNGTEWKDDDQDIINKINTLETTIVDNATIVSNHESRQDNPHNVTKSQVGLSNVPNTDATNRSNHTGTQPASTVSGLSTVATSGSYNDLADKPSIPTEETTSTIQSKRPLKTILNESIEGIGNIDITASQIKVVSNGNLTSNNNQDALVELQNNIDVLNNNIVTNHNNLSGLDSDDHTQYLTEQRHDSLPQDNPHSVTKIQVGLGNVDNTSDLDKPISNLTLTELQRLDFRVVYITEDYTLEDSLNFKGTLNIKNVSEKCLNVLTLTQDKIEEEDSLIIYPDESFTVSKRSDNEYRII